MGLIGVGFLFCGVLSIFFNHLPKEGGWLLYFNCVRTVCFLCRFLIRLWVFLCSVIVALSDQLETCLLYYCCVGVCAIWLCLF